MLESKKIIKKTPLPSLSQSSNISTSSTTDSYSLISKSQPSEDNTTSNSRSRALQYQASLKKLIYPNQPSKSQSTNNQQKKSQNANNLYRKSAPSAPKQPLAKQIVPEEQGDDDDDITFNKLKSIFIDVVESSSTSIESKDHLIDTIKSQMDAQTIRIRRLERALNEKLINGDNENTLPLLLARYPHSMGLFKQQTEQDHYNHQISICIDQFEDQKSRMLEEYQKNFEVLKMKYRSRFDDIVERMIRDPSRLDDEWARRVQKAADDRIEEFKRKIVTNSK